MTDNIENLAARRGAGEGRSLVTRAIDAVKDHIRVHGLRVGDTLPGEAYFAEQVGVSRAVMREAFGAMAALKLVDVGNGRKPRVGAVDGSIFATSLNHAISTAQITVPEVWDVRRTIELRTAALAAASRTEAEADQIVALAEAMAAAIDARETLSRYDIAFHEAIARASHNALFIAILCSFEPLMEIAVPTAWSTRAADSDRRSMIERHRSVAAAIKAGDSARAHAAMDAHFDASVGAVLKGLMPQDASAA
jgi:DNA-binding FadR family transcriptional regulator